MLERAAPTRAARDRRAAARRLSRLHDLGRLARLRRRQDPPPVPGGAGRRLDACSSSRSARTSRTTSGGRASCARRSGRTGARGRRQPALGRRRGDRVDGAGWRRSIPYWIEEPTSPDDILGHADDRPRRRADPRRDRRARPQPDHVQAVPPGRGDRGICQIDACRLGGVNEVLAVLLLAAKFGVPVCPHAGGVGLCELVQHLSTFDYVAVSGSLEDRVIEYVDHLHEHFLDPVVIREGRYRLPTTARLQRRDAAGVAGALPIPRRRGVAGHGPHPDRRRGSSSPGRGHRCPTT